jgi:hypothetical protein
MANFIDTISDPDHGAVKDLAFHIAAKEGETRTQTELVTHFRNLLRQGNIIEMNSIDRKPVDYEVVRA